ncbi:MAG: exodeoxyribonuclease VII large subunit [Ignavibacteriae bacterium]|nr:exodeoxyribonuclease VII large subunit [Ignavibacteriota bacterium]MCB9243438.1 exodeoxyribonuclease VII large subunit [Ignavibacteriales bacterium]
MINPITVSELSQELKFLIEQNFPFIYITGEISNFKIHTASGHYYFSVKDDKAQISCVMWSSRNRFLHVTPEDGMKVVIKGRVTVYEGRGTYQIDVFEVEPAGVGELQRAFERLKEQLQEEGLFDEEHKKDLPEFPQRVGIITSETGAAMHDFCNVTSKRYPNAEIFLFPVTVQGAIAAGTIVTAIKKAHTLKPGLDVLVLARGGGSLEDLWSFNEERVARAIYDAEIPIVSAIGHEIDFTIADFVADLRAPTPSAAAELIFPDKKELLERIKQFEYYIYGAIIDKINNLREILDALEGSYAFNRPMDILDEYKYRLDEIDRSVERTIKEKFYSLNNSLNYIDKILKNVDPQTIMRRGYAVVKRNDEVVSRAEGLKSKDDVSISFFDGSKEAQIK